MPNSISVIECPKYRLNSRRLRILCARKNDCVAANIATIQLFCRVLCDRTLIHSNEFTCSIHVQLKRGGFLVFRYLCDRTDHK